VVGARAGAVPEIVGSAGVLVDALDVDGWAAAITRVAGDASLRARLAALGVARAADFTWAGAARRTLAVHRAALGDASTA
jgi:alpha-1,3-rhamnosyl/mannosyltransferase